MSAGAKIYTQLTTYTGMSALVSTRVYPLLMPQNVTLPAITYQRISGTGQHGSSNIREARYQINIWGGTFAAVQAIATVVRAALEEWTSGGAGAMIRMARIVNELDDYEDDSRTFRTIIDVILHLDE